MICLKHSQLVFPLAISEWGIRESLVLLWHKSLKILGIIRFSVSEYNWDWNSIYPMRGWCAGVLSWVSSALEGAGFAHVYPQHWAQLLRDWGEEAGHAESWASFSASLLQLGGRKSFNQDIFLYWQNCGKFSTLATMISMPHLLWDTRVEFLTSLLWLTKGLFVDENRMCLVIEQRFPRISGPPPKEDPHLLPSLGLCTGANQVASG